MLHFTVAQWTCIGFRGGDHDQPRIRFMTKGKTNWGVGKPGLADISLWCWDEKGKDEIGRSGGFKGSQTMGVPRWEHWFGVERSPGKVVFGAVTKTKVVEVRFSFANVPLS
jgi:hypothetical protein